MTVARVNPSGSVPPPILFLVFNNEVVSHHNEISVVRLVSHTVCHDVAKSIEARASVALCVFNLQHQSVFEEAKEPQSLHDALVCV